jgi:Protein of unknown function (DUF2939)
VSQYQLLAPRRRTPWVRYIVIALVVIAALAFAVMLGVFEYFSPYITVYRMQEAIRSKDPVQLAAYVDFPQLRESIKSTIAENAQRAFNENGRPGGYGGQIATVAAVAAADAAVDAYVTPSSIAQALESGDSQSGGIVSSSMQYVSYYALAGAAAGLVDMHYTSWDRFEIVARQQGGTGAFASVTLCRNGFDWKMCRLTIAPT